MNEKENGGLGLGRLRERNVALLGKWLWKFSVEEGSLAFHHLQQVWA